MLVKRYLRKFWEFLSEFFEASSIHGLVYISTSKHKLTKIFWTLVVLTGFSVAVYLISDSFDNWSSDPYKTIVETKSTSDIAFPKVTVCPAKNAFTDLNFDLILVENKTFKKNCLLP